MHPLRRNAPDQKRCNAYGSGAPPPTTSTTAGNSSPQTPTVHLGRCDTASTCSRRFRARAAAPVTSRCTRYVAAHPLRRDTPDQKGCNAYGSGAPPPTTSPTAGNSPPQTPTIRPGRCDTASTCSPSSEREALHPLRRDAPDQKGCNAYGSGAPPPTTSTTADISSRHTQATASDAATQPRNTRPAPYKRRYTRSVALHPLRHDAPDQKRCNAYRSGAPPLSNKPN